MFETEFLFSVGHDGQLKNMLFHFDPCFVPQILFAFLKRQRMGLLRMSLTCTTEGEFHVDLYTLPDNLIKMLWDFTNERVAVAA